MMNHLKSEFSLISHIPRYMDMWYFYVVWVKMNWIVIREIHRIFIMRQVWIEPAYTYVYCILDAIGVTHWTHGIELLVESVYKETNGSLGYRTSLGVGRDDAMWWWSSRSRSVAERRGRSPTCTPWEKLPVTPNHRTLITLHRQAGLGGDGSS